MSAQQLTRSGGRDRLWGVGTSNRQTCEVGSEFEMVVDINRVTPHPKPLTENKELRYVDDVNPGQEREQE